MTDRRLQKSYCVTGVQPRLPYNDTMNLPFNKQRDVPATSTGSAAGQQRPRGRTCRAGLVVVALLGTGVLATASGGASGTTRQSGARSGSPVSLHNAALAYVNCMRTHGEPNMPDPTFNGRHATLHINPNSGVDPSSPQFSAATNVCQRLAPHQGGTPGGQTITPAEQADYLKAVACMRSHGFPGFPDPVFQNNNVTFSAVGSRIDTNSSQYRSALTTCQKLIPAGLPYSSPSGS
jgi:hypothetical protein